MTTRLELIELIKNGENSGVEFKRDGIENHAGSGTLTVMPGA